MNHARDLPSGRQAPMQTRATALLGIPYPIVQGGMMWVGRAELASAVSNAGGLGMLTALTQPSPHALREEIERCRAMTSQPFGVNLTILPSAVPPPYEAYLDAIIAGGVKVLETAGSSPKEFIAKARAAGLTTIHKCTSVRHALSAERHGVDIISIDGFECAGHPGEDDVGGMVLFPAAARQVKVPLLASGGIADGRGLAAALVLGAEGINMGTRFCATREAPIHAHIKEALVRAGERDTNLIFRTLHNTGRVLKNSISDQVVATERRPGGCEFKDIQPLVSGQRGRAALESGELEGGLVWAGQVVGLIDDIPTCDQLIQRVVAECRERMAVGARAVHRAAFSG
jgi:NAD(P)H-dependent flavin oxidoreductase YrpB (nitropropane dioxygenase family)